MFDVERTIVKTDENGKMKRINVHPTKECFESLQATLDELQEEVDTLEQENKKLHDEHYESEELQKMKKQREEMYKDYSRGFPVSKEEDEKIEGWKRSHIKETHNGNEYSGAIGGSYTYCFTPTSIGTIGTIKCSCGESFCFREI